MTKDEALRLALEALEWQQEMLYTAMQYSAAKGMTFLGHPPNPNEAITAIKAALEAKDEPVAYIYVEQRKLEWAKYMSWGTPTVVNLPKIPLYTTPPQRKPLTDEEIVLIVAECAASHQHTDIHFARAIEAKLKEKNT